MPALALALLTGCGGGAAGPPGARTPDPPIPVASAPGPTGSAAAAPDPGPGADAARPQTSASPVATDPGFAREVGLLWQAVQTGDPAVARPAFFPLPAYLQVKAVRDPGADWQARLWADFVLDVGAAHRLVAADPSATLDHVDVPAAQGTWIAPGHCANRVGYWPVAGARLVYRTAAGLRSFGIASLISWRATWYVVHLGAVTRSTRVGVVDRPATGPGVPGPAGGC